MVFLRRGERTAEMSGRGSILFGLGLIVVTLVLMGLAAGDAAIGSRGGTLTLIGLPAGAIFIVVGIRTSLRQRR